MCKGIKCVIVLREKFLVLLIAGILFTLSALAQQEVEPFRNRHQFGTGFEFVAPLGNFRNIYRHGMGVSVAYQYPVSENLKITGKIGYIKFAEQLDVFGYSSSSIPLKAGAKYFLGKYVYGSAELGAAFFSSRIHPSYGDGTKIVKTDDGTSFIYAPGAGVEFAVDRFVALDLSMRYETWAKSGNNNSFLGLRLGIVFGL